MPGKDVAIILDHAGNAMRHGLPDEEREWSLHAKKRKRANSDEATVGIRQCESCFHVHAPAPLCPKCGFVYPIKKRELEIDESVELEKIDKAALSRQKRTEVGMTKSLDALAELGRARGYRNPRKWAEHVMSGRRKKEEKRECASLSPVSSAE